MKRYTCDKCGGSGYYSYLRDLECMKCDGTGVIEIGNTSNGNKSFFSFLGEPFFGLFNTKSNSSKSKRVQRKSTSHKAEERKFWKWKNISLFEKFIIISVIIFMISKCS